MIYKINYNKVTPEQWKEVFKEGLRVTDIPSYKIKVSPIKGSEFNEITLISREVEIVIFNTLTGNFNTWGISPEDFNHLAAIRKLSEYIDLGMSYPHNSNDDTKKNIQGLRDSMDHLGKCINLLENALNMPMMPSDIEEAHINILNQTDDQLNLGISPEWFGSNKDD